METVLCMLVSVCSKSGAESMCRSGCCADFQTLVHVLGDAVRGGREVARSRSVPGFERMCWVAAFVIMVVSAVC